MKQSHWGFTPSDPICRVNFVRRSQGVTDKEAQKGKLQASAISASRRFSERRPCRFFPFPATPGQISKDKSPLITSLCGGRACRGSGSNPRVDAFIIRERFHETKVSLTFCRTLELFVRLRLLPKIGRAHV